MRDGSVSKRTRGMRHYATIMAGLKAEPDSTSRLAARLGIDLDSTRRVIRQLHALKLIHICKWIPKMRGVHNAGGIQAAVWAVGEGVDAAAPAGTSGRPLTTLSAERPRLKAEMLAFAEVWQLLASGPLSTPEISNMTGIDRGAVRMLIHHMRRLKLARIAAYDPDMNFAPVALFTLGAARDADRPKRMSREEINRRQRQRDRSLSMLRATPRPFDLMASQLASA